MTDNFQYQPLANGSSSVRLLSIARSVRGSHEIRCSLTEYQAHEWDSGLDGLVEYAAISYTWGDELPSKTLYVNDRPMQVRVNCWNALWLARTNRLATKYWIDAVSINQADDEEKGLQVQMMGQIFSRAQRTLVCLAKDGIPSEIIRQLSAASPGLSVDEDQPQHQGKIPEPDLVSLLRDLAANAYWNRLWVVQELLLSVEIWVVAGAHRISWKNLRLRYLDSSFPDTGGEHAVMLYRLLSELPRARQTKPKPQGGNDEVRSLADCVVYNLFNFNHVECTLPRDKIYGLLALGRRHDLDPTFNMDYSVDYAQSGLDVLIDLVDGLSGFSSLFTSTTVIARLVKDMHIPLDSDPVQEFLQSRAHAAKPMRQMSPTQLLTRLRASPDSIAVLCQNHLHKLPLLSHGGGTLRYDASLPQPINEVDPAVVIKLSFDVGIKGLLLCRPVKASLRPVGAQQDFEIVAQCSALAVGDAEQFIEDDPRMTWDLLKPLLHLHPRDMLAMQLIAQKADPLACALFTTSATASYLEVDGWVWARAMKPKYNLGGKFDQAKFVEDEIRGKDFDEDGFEDDDCDQAYFGGDDDDEMEGDGVNEDGFCRAHCG